MKIQNKDAIRGVVFPDVLIRQIKKNLKLIFSNLENRRNEKRDNQKVVSLFFSSLNRSKMDFCVSDVLLEFFPRPEGYVKATAMNINPSNPEYAFNYVFNYTDHLGNVRVSYTKDPQTGNLKILDESHYYPFGLKHQEYVNFGFASDQIQGVIITPITNNPYKYKYNGKEWQDELGLNMYAMDMRQYDPAIARWVVMDPVIHHSVSPYSAFDNNPVFWADPSGAAPELGSVFEQSGMKVASLEVQGTGTSIGAGGVDGGELQDSQNDENDGGGKSSQSGGKPENGGKQVLKNTSTNPDHIIYFKPEGPDTIVVNNKEYKPDGAYPLKPGESWEHGFDGVAAPHISKGTIFKASNGVSVTVSDKSITWSGGRYDSKLAMYAGNIFSGSDYTGGWKTESWLRDLTASSVTTTTTSWKTGMSNESTTIKKSDSSWINLFDKAGLKNAQDYRQSHTINRRAGGF